MVRLALRHVRILAGRIGPRPASSAAYRRAALYVRSVLSEAGYQAGLVPFPLPAGERSWNVLGTRHRARPPRLVIGAHLDTVPRSPGANDNASGVAVMLEVARAVAGTRGAPSIRFVAFGAEEEQLQGGHHIGSAAYARSLGTRREGLRAMVSVDMVGRGSPVMVGWMGQGPDGAVRALVASARRAGVPVREAVVDDVSDNGPFERAGVPAALLWTGPEPAHHLPTDVVPRVGRRELAAAGRVLLGLTRRIFRP